MKLEDNYYILLIPKLRLWVPLGCTLEERANPQPVDIDIKIDFLNEPTGCQSDKLTDVVCYDTLSKKISKAVTTRSFNLIEFLAAYIFEVIASQVKQQCIVEVSVAKPNHPVLGVNAPIVFKYAKKINQNSP